MAQTSNIEYTHAEPITVSPTYSGTASATTVDVENSPFDLVTVPTASWTVGTIGSCNTPEPARPYSEECEYCHKSLRGRPGTLCSPCKDLTDLKILKWDSDRNEWYKGVKVPITKPDLKYDTEYNGTFTTTGTSGSSWGAPTHGTLGAGGDSNGPWVNVSTNTTTTRNELTPFGMPSVIIGPPEKDVVVIDTNGHLERTRRYVNNVLVEENYGTI